MNRKDRRRNRKLERREVQGPSPAQPLFADAARKLDAGDVAAAEGLLTQAIAADPRHAEAHHLMGLLDYRAGRFEDAAERMLEAATLEEGNPVFNANCAAVLNLIGRAPEAEAASRHAIALKPDYAEAYNSLAVALDVQNRRGEAIAAAEQAAAIRPDYVEAHINLGNVHMRGGDFDHAQAAYERALSIAPQNAMARANLAAALRRRGDLAAAEREAREAVRLNLNYAEGHATLALVLKDQGDFDDAVVAIETAIRLRPGFAEAHVNLGALRYQMGEAAAAEEAYRKAIEMAPKFADAHAGLGVVLLGVGRLDEAVAAFREAVKVNPFHADAWYDLASSGATLSTDEANNLRRLSDAGDLAPDAKAKIRFAQGEVAERTGKHADAFAHFRAGNGIRRKALIAAGQGFDADTHDAFVDALIATFDDAFLAARKDFGDPTEAPLFVVGLPRSGTTLVQQIAASHPAAADVGESGGIDVVAAGIDSYPHGVVNLSKDDIANRARVTLDWLKDAAGEGATRILDKTPRNVLHLGLIRLLFPNARIVHCLRDIRDTALSCYVQNFVDGHAWSTDLGDLARYVKAHRRIVKHWRRVRPLPTLEVVYEDLVGNQEGESRRLIDFLGLEWDDACLDFHRRDGVVRTASNWQVRRPIGAGSVGRWQKHEADLKPFLDALGDVP